MSGEKSAETVKARNDGGGSECKERYLKINRKKRD